MQKIPEAFKNSQTCMCGIANMCVSCLRSRVDISEAIPKQVSVHFCRQCERYLQPPGTWLQCALESRELLALCLKKLKASMAKVRLIDAGFLWTEPHSKRIMMKLSIQKEVTSMVCFPQCLSSGCCVVSSCAARSLTHRPAV
uniref:60S ribosomal export protein NMD3 n=1 Tax=Cyprinus carpio TaxID=7962 RepID=A0A8C2GCN4_CYPCA